MPIKYAKFLLNIWQSVELIIFVFPFLFLIIKSKMLAHRISSRDAAIFPNSKCISRHRASGGQASCCSYTNWPQHAQGCLIVYSLGRGGGGGGQEEALGPPEMRHCARNIKKEDDGTSCDKHHRKKNGNLIKYAKQLSVRDTALGRRILWQICNFQFTLRLLL